MDINNEISNKNNVPYHWFYLDGFINALNEPPAIREAMARHNLYTNAPVYINPGELIVGNLDWALYNEPVINRISAHYVQQSVIDNIMDEPSIDSNEKKLLKHKLKIFAPYVLYNKISNVLSEEEQLVKECGIASSCHFNGHMILDYSYILEKGLKGVLQDLIKFLNAELTDEQKQFYDALKITISGMMEYIKRHGDLAEELISNNNPNYDRDMLITIRDNCYTIAEETPQNFLQALQLLWFMMNFADYDSFGRFDQYMYPFYKKSAEEGMTDDEALVYLKHLWNKIEQCGYILNMTIGGILPNGNDGVNELTYLALKITRQLRFKSPNLCLRIRSDSPYELWQEVYENLSTGQSLPALYNESLIIKIFENSGIKSEDARDFALAGCSQVFIPGKSSFACDMGEYNVLKCLELALHNGFDERLGKQVGPYTGTPDDLDTYEKFLDAYRKQIKYAIEMGVSINNKDYLVRNDDCSCVRSMFTRDCLAKGKGIFQGGARYYGVQNEVIGLTNTANSLMAIKKVVYEEKGLTLKELVDILDKNYEGNEDLRLMLLNRIPKFGNDIDEVDKIRADITEEFFKELNKHHAEPSGYHMPGEVIFTYHISHGKEAIASPDGRFAYEPLADSAGPSQGTDLNGPTAVINSMLKLPLELYKTCCCLNMKFSPSLWRSGKEKIISLFRSYFERGGYQLQINVVDKETLIEAKKNPEKFKSLVVRVGGYSAYFVTLPSELQDEIITRTEHKI